MKLPLSIAVLVFLILQLLASSEGDEKVDFYKLLNISRDATLREIRKAFKELAVKLHPDKNKDKPNAEEEFLVLMKAYETLKDPDKRKHYDLHGDTGDDQRKWQKTHFPSWTYYHDQFGIYDDDPLIVTLSQNDYEVNILDDTQAWFVNFYSPHCSHCHELAPTWRKLAQELEGVIRIAAVNCEDDHPLCYQLSINAYPTLIYYEKESHLYEGIHYRSSRTLEALKEFVFSKVSIDIKDVSLFNWNNLKYKEKDWILFLCPEDNSNCPEKETRLKLAATFEGLLPVGTVTDSELAEQISIKYRKSPIIYWKAKKKEEESQFEEIPGSDAKEIVENILNKLPNPETIDEQRFKEIRRKLRQDKEDNEPEEHPWLICFYLGPATELNLQLKRLPTLIPQINIGLVHCGRSAGLCSSLHVARYPTWGVLKVGGAFELHHGRDILHEVATFARDSVKSTNLHALSPADFQNIVNEGSVWLIDWYAPWCPPCRKLMPEIRKVSQQFKPEQIKFGTIDCTLHTQLCSEHGIGTYPTVAIYNGTQTQRFHGILRQEDIKEFISDMLTHTVINLDESNFVQLMRKSPKEMWAVDFYAPWCGPCQRLAPEWRKLAKEMKEFEEIKIAQVDCVANSDLCHAQNVNSYPTIRLYPLGSKGMNTVALYNGKRDAISLKRWLISFLPTVVEEFNEDEFRTQILTKDYILPWIVDFYAPWCAHCVHFEPEFRTVALRLEGEVRSAKVDCEKNRHFCGHLHIHAYPTVRLYFSPKEFYTIESFEAPDVLKQVRKLMKERKNRANVDHDEL